MALTSTARPEKQNGQVIPDSEDERVLGGVSVCYTGKNCNEKLLVVVCSLQHRRVVLSLA